MLRPLILFLTGRNRKTVDCVYAPVATDEEPIPVHLHPLLIPLVISKIASHLSVNDLLSFRLVCHSWHAESYKLLQNKIKYVKVHSRKMNEFLRVWIRIRKSDPVPAKGFSFYVEHPEHLYLLKQITENLSWCISSLRLFISSQEIPNVSFILQNLCMLQDLVLLRIPEKNLPPSYRKYEILEDELRLPHLTSISFRNTHPNLPLICNYDNFIVDIIQSAANLSMLEFKNWKSSLQQIIRFCDLPASLEKLHLKGSAVKESEMEAFIKKKKNFRLKSVKINFGKNIRDSTLISFFESLQDSLEILDITSDGVSANFPVHCDLPHLKTLKFQSWKCQIILDNFVVKFPMLETVELLDFHFISFTDYRGNGPSSSSLVHTVHVRPCLQDEYLPLAELNVASIVTAFPNAKNFTGSFISDPMCDLIFKYWPQLEYLSLESCGDLTDFALTGILPEVLAFYRDSCHCVSMNKTLNYQNPPERVNNHLGNLKGLKRLFLLGDFNGLLTNGSLLYGILDLENLIELGIPDDAFHWCFECMASKLKNLKKLYVDPNGKRFNAQDLLFLKERISTLHIIELGKAKI